MKTDIVPLLCFGNKCRHWLCLQVSVPLLLDQHQCWQLEPEPEKKIRCQNLMWKAPSIVFTERCWIQFSHIFLQTRFKIKIWRKI